MYIILQKLFASIESILAKQFLRNFLSFYCLHLTHEIENYLLKTKTKFYYDHQNIKLF